MTQTRIYATFGVLLLITIVISKETNGRTSHVGRSNMPNIYDILSLIYRLCSVNEGVTYSNLECLDQHMKTEVAKKLNNCFARTKSEDSGIFGSTPPDKNETDEIKNDTNDKRHQKTNVDYICEQFTKVSQWSAKHPKPPDALTKVIGLGAVGRMICVMGIVQRPLDAWENAFSECFPQEPKGKHEIQKSYNE
ncbi:uncharacterized protein [Centruroides vittatus]|uniref:uncharacterized protein n=1 Tax=Centruroides vittatus TaxID=120091 RepID=UPI00350F85CD